MNNSKTYFSVAALSTLCYFLASVFMTLSNKLLFDKYKFDGNLTLVFIQNLLTMIFLIGLKSAKWIDFDTKLDPSKIKAWAPMTALFLTMLVTGSYGLRFLSVPIVVVFKNLSTAMVAFGDWYLYSSVLDACTTSSVVAMILGAGAAAIIDLSQDPSKDIIDKESYQSQLFLGYTFLILNCFASAGYVLYMKRIVHKLAMSDWSMMYYNMFLSSVAIFIPVCYELAHTSTLSRLLIWQSSGEFDLVLVIITSGIIGFILSWTTFSVVKLASPTIYSLTGSFNKVLLTVLGALLFNTHLTMGGYVAVWFALTAAVCFSTSKAWKKPNTNLGNTKDHNNNETEQTIATIKSDGTSIQNNA